MDISVQAARFNHPAMHSDANHPEWNLPTSSNAGCVRLLDPCKKHIFNMQGCDRSPTLGSKHLHPLELSYCSLVNSANAYPRKSLELEHSRI